MSKMSKMSKMSRMSKMSNSILLLSYLGESANSLTVSESVSESVRLRNVELASQLKIGGMSKHTKLMCIEGGVVDPRIFMFTIKHVLVNVYSKTIKKNLRIYYPEISFYFKILKIINIKCILFL